MLRPDNEIQLYLYSEPVDMRKSMNGLSILVEQEMALYVGTGRRATRAADSTLSLCRQSPG